MIRQVHIIKFLKENIYFFSVICNIEEHFLFGKWNEGIIDIANEEYCWFSIWIHGKIIEMQSAVVGDDCDVGKTDY